MKTAQNFIDEYSNQDVNSTKMLKEYFIEYTKEAIKIDRENVSNHATTIEQYAPNCDDHTPYWGACVSCGRYNNPNVLIGEKVDKDSIINAPNIELL